MSTTPQPAVGVVVPAYNAEQWVEATLRSLQDQTLQDWLAVVVDDGSSDDTAMVVERAIAADPRITLVSQANSGVASARNAGLAHLPAQCGLIAFIDSDDIYERDALGVLVEALAQRPDAVGAYGLAEYIDEDGRPIEGKRHSEVQKARRELRGRLRMVSLPPDADTTFATLQVQGPLWPAAVGLHRRSAIEAVGGFDAAMTVMEDLDLYIRMSRLGPFVAINERVASYRRHTSNLTGDHDEMMYLQRQVLRAAWTSLDNTPEQRQQVLNTWRYLDARQVRQMAVRCATALRRGQWRVATQRLLGSAVVLGGLAGSGPSAMSRSATRLMNPRDMAAEPPAGPRPSRMPTFCVYDDRATHLDAVRLAVLSIVRFAPGARIIVSLPEADEATVEWFTRLDGVETVVGEDFGASGWDVKPALLLHRLDQGHDDVVWWDSDILAGKPFLEYLEVPTSTTLLATEDTWWGEQQGTDYRTRAWGLPVGRVLPAALNSGLLRVTPSHRPLLEAWRELLRRSDYLDAQAKPSYLRPLYQLGDQEALAALLGSVRFADVPLRMLRRGGEIAQCWGPAGFRVRERLPLLFSGGPPLIHAIVAKPWERLVGGRFPAIPRSADRDAWYRFYTGLHAEIAPYTVLARSLCGHLPSVPAWLTARSSVGRALEALPGNSLVVPELPLAVVDSVVRARNRRRNPARHRLY